LKKVKIALVPGDGAAPEMMEQAARVVVAAAELDGIEIEFVETPMGWAAFSRFGDTLPKESLETATALKILFFGGVGDPRFDKTIGKDHPEMLPEPRCLLGLRKNWGLLLNFRPIFFYKALAPLARVRPENIPETGIKQIWLRFLLEDSYFGNADLLAEIPPATRQKLGIKLKAEINGDEAMVLDLAYFRKVTLEKYFREAFKCARREKLPLISVDKANVMGRYVFWRNVCSRIGREEFPEVELRHHYVDSASALLLTPAALNGVIACGNEHGDILSDTAAAALGSLGLMCSSSLNPDSGLAMFESGAGTAPSLAGQNRANPLGRILTGALMLKQIGALRGAGAIEEAVKNALSRGFRTEDLALPADNPANILGTKAMGEKVLSLL
jgi:3-isopropylmalate dehydrogenase